MTLHSITWTLLALAIGAGAGAADANEPSVPKDFLVELVRGPCEGACPSYAVSVDGEGNVRWDGRDFVEQKGGASKVISASALQSIAREVAAIRFSELGSGSRLCLDTPDVVIEITANAKTKAVHHDSCSQTQTPEGRRIAELARFLDSVLGTEPWVGQQPARAPPAR